MVCIFRVIYWVKRPVGHHFLGRSRGWVGGTGLATSARGPGRRGSGNPNTQMRRRSSPNGALPGFPLSFFSNDNCVCIDPCQPSENPSSERLLLNGSSTIIPIKNIPVEMLDPSFTFE
jgi:hypothetical protein